MPAVLAHADAGEELTAQEQAFLAHLLGAELTAAQAESLERLGPQALHAGYLAALGGPGLGRRARPAPSRRRRRPARRTARVAAVVGEKFEEALVRAVLADDVAFEPAMGAVEDSGLVLLAAVEPERVYAFRHALVRAAANESLLRQERRRLQGAVGETLERVHGDDSERAGTPLRAGRRARARAPYSSVPDGTHSTTSPSARPAPSSTAQRSTSPPTTRGAESRSGSPG